MFSSQRKKLAHKNQELVLTKLIVSGIKFFLRQQSSQCLIYLDRFKPRWISGSDMLRPRFSGVDRISNYILDTVVHEKQAGSSHGDMLLWEPCSKLQSNMRREPAGPEQCIIPC